MADNEEQKIQWHQLLSSDVVPYCIMETLMLNTKFCTVCTVLINIPVLHIDLMNSQCMILPLNRTRNTCQAFLSISLKQELTGTLHYFIYTTGQLRNTQISSISPPSCTMCLRISNISGLNLSQQGRLLGLFATSLRSVVPVL